MLNKLLIGAGVAFCITACASNHATLGAATPTYFGHAYTQKDMKRTGATDAGQALRLLDPTVTISGPGTAVLAR